MRSRGFTLLETAIVVTIFALIMATAAPLIGQYFKQKATNTTNENAALIKSALASYLAATGRLPCPAIINPTTAADVGVQNGNTAPAANRACSAPSTVNPAGRRVYRGLVPFFDLGLTQEQASDGYYSEFDYYVTETAVTGGDNPASPAPASDAIGVFRDAAKTIRLSNNPVVAIVSHGRNGYGSQRFVGGNTYTAMSAPATFTNEAENYNPPATGDADLVFSQPSDKQDTAAEQATYFDDKVFWWTASGLIPPDTKASQVYNDQEQQAVTAAMNAMVAAMAANRTCATTCPPASFSYPLRSPQATGAPQLRRLPTSDTNNTPIIDYYGREFRYECTDSAGNFSAICAGPITPASVSTNVIVHFVSAGPDGLFAAPNAADNRTFNITERDLNILIGNYYGF